MSMCKLIHTHTHTHTPSNSNIMETKNFQQTPHKHNHTRTPNLTWKTLQCRGKNHMAATKNIHYKIEITTIKFYAKLEFIINWIYNK